MNLAEIPTPVLLQELQGRKAQHRAELAAINRALGERDGVQLGDARRVMAVGEAIAAETNLEGYVDLIAYGRTPRVVTPRKILHWWLRTQDGWDWSRIALHCERDRNAITNSVEQIAADLELYLPVIERIRGRLELRKIAVA